MGVAQLVESRIVIPVVVGSSPISHPRILRRPRWKQRGFLFTDAPRSFNDLQRRPPRRESADAHVGIQHSLKRRKNLNRELISARREHDAAHKDNLPQKATVQARKNLLPVIKVAEKTTA